MKKIISLILVLFALTGCAIAPLEPTVTLAPTPSPSEGGLMTRLKSVSDEGNLWYIHSSDIEEMTSSSMYLFGGDLLFSAPNGTGTALMLISIETGEVIGKYQFDGTNANVQIVDERIILTDPVIGKVLILNKLLTPAASYELTPKGDFWSVCTKENEVYIFSSGGITRKPLSDDEKSSKLLSDVTELCVLNINANLISFSYSDTDEKRQFAIFNSLTGEIKFLPIKTSATTLDSYKKIRLLYSPKVGYTIVDDADIKSCDFSDGSLRLTSAGDILAVQNNSLALYSPADGAFISHCAFDDTFLGSLTYYNNEEGCFFLTTDSSGKPRLMFWKTSVNIDGEPLEMSDTGILDQNDLSMDQLKVYAKQLENKYGILMHIGDDILLEYPEYTITPLNDPSMIAYSMSLVESALEKYPDGFLGQLKFDEVKHVRFDIVGGVSHKSGTDGIDDVGGLANQQGNTYMIVLNADYFNEEVIYHELSHVIDNKLLYDSFDREDALYSEEKWLSLQPKGFDFDYSYLNYPDFPSSLAKYEYSGYFLTSYSMTYPTEDRAVILASAMNGNVDDFNANPKAYDKLDYYSKCIRDAFDTTGWPAETSWETMLKNREN